MMRRSGRRRCTFLSRPSSVSVARLRSCASSTITTLRKVSGLGCDVVPAASHLAVRSKFERMAATRRLTC